MAALPLALDTLQSPSIEEPATAQFPVMSPQLLKADTSNNTLVTTTPERPSNLTLDSSQQQQQHSNNTPTHGTISPALSSAGSLSPSFLPEMPQWKRDLIQRRKQNVQRTISASSPTATAAVSSPLAASPTTSSIYGLKTSTSSSSVRSLAGSNTNIDQVASDGLHTSTKDYNKTSSSAYSASSSSSLSTAATTKVNKQHATTTTTTTTTAMPATIIKSPIQEKAEKLFGGQYTATSSSSSLSLSLPSSASISATVTTLTITKEEKKITTITQQELMEGLLENEEAEHWEKSKKTKEYMIDTEEEDENENDETQISTVTTTTSNKQQMATRLTGSTHNNVVGQREDMLKERELILNNIQHNNITGANVILKNQSLNKCESERLVCAANISSCSSTAVTNNINNNTSCSVTSGINSSNSSSVVKISQKLQDNQFIKNEQQQHQQINTKKFIKFKTNSYSQDLKSPTKATSSSASALATNCAIKKKMVAVQEMKKSTQNTATHLHPMPTTCNNSQQANIRANNRSAGGVANSSASNATDLDNNEDLSYGPGIVSKLRCRYLSLALRESMEQQRLNKDQLRRSTSLNNLLDNNEDDDENCDDEDEDDEDEENIEVEGDLHDNKKNNENSVCKKTGILKNSCNNQDKRFSQGSNGVGVTFTETSFNKRSRHLKRGNDSLKRARSVEALLSEKSPWQSRTINTTPTCVTIEDKIHNARERLHQGTEHMPPKRLTSIIDDTERPPPDLVKQTLKMFEASANRRPRLTNRSNSKGDVASKVETFKNIIKDQKPVVSYPKPASPTKKLNTTPLQKPVKTSTPQASDLLQSPLGRKTLATANSNSVNDGLTPLKTNNTLSDNTPDIIPRQKVLNERDFKQTKEKFTTNQINKEKFLNSIRDTPLSNVEIMDSPLNVLKREQKEKFEVDSPLTALTKELSKLKLSDNNTPTRKIDNFSSDKYEISNGGGGSAGGDSVSGDACLSHKNPHNNEENKELNSSLKNENDKQKQINNETIEETTNEATVNYNDCSATKASPPPSSSDLSDGEEDDEYGGLKTKRITRTALDNIAKAGYTQQFKFNSSASNTPNNTHSTSSPLNSVKQIGVIRPLLNTNQQQQQQKISSDMDTLKHSTFSSLTSREIEKNRINDLKKSSSTQPSSATSSPNTSLDNVIKSTSSSSASSNTEVDTVISATNSPLWAMRKRRQAPPAAPAENTTMVFNFSNRKEVPDYIENDGVIFRRKRELPKPNESGFVLLGDLSVETSTDFDCDDFSMCPPSPCDVEFENANIVIDGKSSIRQKPKDASFRVQFNDTLTSTFEYPSEASLIVDDSFSAYNHGYTQPHGSSGDDFTHAFQNLVLENFTSSADQMSHQFPLHHVADEIIQLPTNQASSPANTTTEVTTPTKNILGNLPLDYPDLEKGIQLTIPTTVTSAPIKTQDNESKRSRKDLKLPLENHQLLQKPPPLPMKRFQMMPLQANRQNSEGLLTNSKDLQLQKKIALNASKHKEEFQNGKTFWDIKKDCRDDNSTSIAFKQRKTPRVLNNPQYACFLQQHESPTKYPVQRSRSNEFRKSFGSLNMSTPVLRSNSLRNLEKFHTSNALTSTSFTTTTSLYFSAEVNSTIENLLSPKVKPAKNPAKEYRTLKSVSLHNIPQSSESFENFSNSCHELTECLDNMPNNLMKSPQICTLDSFRQTLSPSKSLTALTIEDNACCKTENFLNFKTESLDNLNSSNNLTFNMLTSLTNEGDNIVSPKDFHYSTEYSVNMEENFLNSKSNSIDNISSTEMAENFMNSKTKSLNNLAPTKSSHNLPDCSGNVRKTVSKSQSTSVGSLTATVRSTVNDLTEYFALQSITKSIDTIKTNDTFNSLTEQSVKKNDYLLKPKTISIDNANFNVSSNESAEYSSGLTNNLVNFKSQKLTQGPSIASLINLNKTLQMSIDSLDDYQDAVDGNQECFETPTNSVKTDCNLINLPNNNSLNLAESCVNNKVESITDLHLIESNETLKETSKVSQPLQPLRDSEALDILEEIDVGSHKESQAKCKDKLKDSEALAILEIIAIGPHNQLSLPASKKQLNDSKSLEILEDIAVGLDTPSLFDFTELIGADKGKSYTDGIGNKSTNDISAEKVVRLEDSCKTQENPNNIISKISENAQFKPIDPAGLSTTVPIKTTQKLFNFANLSCENISTYSAFRKSQNFRTHTSDSFRNSLKFYETLNEKTPELSDEFSNNSVSIKRSVSFTDSLSNKDEINGNFLVNSSRTEDIKETKQINNPDAPKENSFSLDNYDTFGNLNGNLVNHSSLKENVAKATDTDCVINNKNLLKQKNQDIDLKLDINSNLASGKANELKEEGLNITKDCSGIHSKLPKNLCDFLTNKSLDSPHFLADFGLPENRVENIKTCLTKQLDTLLRPINLKETPVDFNINTSSNTELHSAVKEADSNLNINENSFEINANLTTNNFSHLNLSLQPNNDYNINTSPLPFRRKYEAITVVVSPENCPLSDPLCDLNSAQSLALTSPRPFKGLAKTVDSFTKANTASDCPVNFKNTQRLTNCFGTLTNNFDYLTKSVDSALNVDSLGKSSSFIFTKKETQAALVNSTEIFNLNLTKIPVDTTKTLVRKPLTTNGTLQTLGNSKTASIKSKTFDISTTTTADPCSSKVDLSLVTESATKFSTHSPTLAPKTFSNTKHLKLAVHDNSSISSTSWQTVKDPSTTTTTTNKSSLKNYTNFETKVEVSKPNTYSTTISQTPSSFSSTHLCRTSSEANSTVKTQQLTRKATTIASNSTNPPKVLPRRIFTAAPTNLVATMTCSSTSYTATTATSPVSSSSSSTSSCYNASISTTTSNSTPLRRRIPGNTLYYV